MRGLIKRITLVIMIAATVGLGAGCFIDVDDDDDDSFCSNCYIECDHCNPCGYDCYARCDSRCR